MKKWTKELLEESGYSKDHRRVLGGDGITSVFHRTSLPERFVLHWCKMDKVCICDLIGWKVGKEAQDDSK